MAIQTSTRVVRPQTLFAIGTDSPLRLTDGWMDRQMDTQPANKEGACDM